MYRIHFKILSFQNSFLFEILSIKFFLFKYSSILKFFFYQIPSLFFHLFPFIFKLSAIEQRTVESKCQHGPTNNTVDHLSTCAHVDFSVSGCEKHKHLEANSVQTVSISNIHHRFSRIDSECGFLLSIHIDQFGGMLVRSISNRRFIGHGQFHYCYIHSAS